MGGGGGAGVWRRLYAVFLRLLPRTFRAEWGSEMAEVFSRRIDECGGVASRFLVFAGGVLDVLTQSVALRRAGGRPGEGGSRGERAGFGSVGQDLRHALRSLRRSPAFSALAIATLALGVGATTAVFTVLNAVLLRPLPYAQPDRLVAVWPAMNFNTAMVRRVAESVPALEGISGISIWTMVVAGDGADPEEVEVGLVSASHFDVLGIQPFLGRGFAPEEGWKGAGDVTVLSYDFWMRRYDGDPEIIGRRIPLAGASHDTRTVVGVMPRSFRPVVPGHDLAAWVPLEDTPGLSVAADSTFYVNWRVGRLAQGGSADLAAMQLKTLVRQIDAEWPRMFEDGDIASVTVEPLQENRVGSTRGILWLLLGAVSLVLLISCANVANLLLARGETRIRELAVRRALGARSGRLVRQLLTESLVLALLAGALGVAVAWGLLRVILSQLPPAFPEAATISIDPWVIGFAAGVSVVSAIVFGVLPARRAGSAAASEALRQGSRGAVGARSRRGVSGVLVGLEIALAVLLVIGSTLMLRTLQRLNDVQPGFQPDGLLVLRPSPPGGGYDDAEAMRRFHAEVIQRLEALPEVESAAGIQLLPVTFGNWRFPVVPEGFEIAEGSQGPSVNFRVITPGYFETMRIRLLEGRTIQPSDRMDAQHVAVINQTMAGRMWPGEDPIGRTVRTFNASGEAYVVVGVVADVNQQSLDTAPLEEMYVPHDQIAWLVPMFTVVRVRAGEPMRIAPAIRDAIWSIEPETAISGLETYDSVLGRSAATTRFLTLLLGFFGMLALVLGATGVYGVTAFTTARRIPEFGVRLALGASRRSVLESALLRALRPVIVGIGFGCLAAAALAGLLRSMLFGIQPRDPLTFVVVPILLGMVGIGAILAPAWKAARLDPATVLRTE